MHSIRNKQNRIWMRCLASALLFGCVLAFVPSQLLAQWVIHLAPGGTMTADAPSGTAHSVNYKFFTYVKRESETYEKPGTTTTTYYNSSGTAVGTTPISFANGTGTGTTGADCEHVKSGWGSASDCNTEIAISIPAHSYTRGSYTKSFSAATFSIGYKGAVSIGGQDLSGMKVGDTVTVTLANPGNDSPLNGSVAGTDGAAASYVVTLKRVSASHSHKTGLIGSKTYEAWQFSYSYTTNITTWNTVVTPATTVTTVARDENVFLSSTVETDPLAFGDASSFVTSANLYAGDKIPKISTQTLNDVKSLVKTKDKDSGEVFDLISIAGFFQANADGSPSKTQFDFSAPMGEKDVTVWVEWTTARKGADNSLGDFVNNQSYSSIKVGAGDVFTDAAENGTYFHNVSSDTGYGLSGNVISFGSPEKPTTLTTGSELLFCMSSGVTQVGASATAGNLMDTKAENETDATWNKTDKWVSVDYYGSTSPTKVTATTDPLEYTVVLQNDLYISGTVEIAGYTGAHNNSVAGHIIGRYVKLDLNGNNIIVKSGGVLQSYGLIVDSVGTGTIYVEPGGTLLTQLVTYDVNGGNNTVWRYMKGFSPFEQYSLPYINARVEILVNQLVDGTDVKHAHGSLRVFTKLHSGDLDFRSIYINLIGGSGYLFNISTSGDSAPKGKVVIRSTKLQNSNFQTAVIAQSLNVKNELAFENVDVKFEDSPMAMSIKVAASSIEVTANMNLEFARMVFPMSSMMDISVKNGSQFTLKQQVHLQPGCTFTVDESSTLYLSYRNGVTFYKPIVIDNIPLVDLNGIFKDETKNLAGGIYATDAYLTEDMQYVNKGDYVATRCLNAATYATFWNVYGAAALNVYGTLRMDGGGTAAYAIGGNAMVKHVEIVNGKSFDWSAEALTVSNFTNNANALVKFRTYDLQFAPSEFYWLSSSDVTDNAVGLALGNNPQAYGSAMRIYSSPMHGGGTAYLFNSETGGACVAGTYDDSTGLLKSGSTYYAFKKTNDRMLSGDPSASSYQMSEVDRSVTIWTLTESQVDTTMKTVTKDGNTYVYFAGQYLLTSAYNSVVDEETNAVTSATATVNMQAYVTVTGKQTAMQLTYDVDNEYWTLTAAG